MPDVGNKVPSFIPPARAPNPNEGVVAGAWVVTPLVATTGLLGSDKEEVEVLQFLPSPARIWYPS